MNAEEILRRAAVVTRLTARRSAAPEPPQGIEDWTAPGPGPWYELPATRHWPDPYGPDKTVFGTVPLVRGN